jgi:hypothetical protein
MDSTEDDAAEVGIHADVATVSKHLALEASDMADDESYVHIVPRGVRIMTFPSSIFNASLN